MQTEAMHYRQTYSHELTTRQKDVIRLIAKGRTNFEIAGELGIGLETVKMHVSEVLARLDVRSREDAAAWWRHYQSPSARLARAVNAMGLLVSGKAAAIAGATGVVFVAAVGLAAALYLGTREDDRTASETSLQESAAVPTPQSSAAGPRVQQFGTPFTLARSAASYQTGRDGDRAWAIESTGDGAYWIDLKTGESQPVTIAGRRIRIELFDGRLFGITDRGAIFEADPNTGQEVRRINVEGLNGAYWLHVTPDSFWVGDLDLFRVFRIDRRTEKVVRVFDQVTSYAGVFEAEGYLWINEDVKDDFVRIDLATNEMTRHQVWNGPSPRRGDGGCGRCSHYLTYRDGTIWLTGHHGIAHFDAKAGALLLDHVFPSTIAGLSQPPVWVSDGSMWLVIEANDRPGGSYVARVDPATMAELEQLPLSLVARGHLQLDDDTLLVFGATGEMEKVRLVP